MHKNTTYKLFLTEISTFVSPKRIYTDELRRLAWGTDAGFYRLIPQIVIRSINEEEVARLMKTADKYNDAEDGRDNDCLCENALGVCVFLLFIFWDDVA